MAALRLDFKDSEDLVRTVIDSKTTHWFDADSQVFFRSRISEEVYAGRVFVTGERNPSGIRRYSVRLLCDNEGSYCVQNVSGFGAYAREEDALAAADRFAAKYGDALSGEDARYVDDDKVTEWAESVDIPTTGGF